MKTGDVVMREMLETFEARAKVYGNNYLIIGKVMEAMLPDGITLRTADDHNAFHLFLMQMVKMTRLANTDLKHIDSAHDSAVYGAMLAGLIDTEGGPVCLPSEKFDFTSLEKQAVIDALLFAQEQTMVSDAHGRAFDKLRGRT